MENIKRGSAAVKAGNFGIALALSLGLMGCGSGQPPSSEGNSAGVATPKAESAGPEVYALGAADTYGMIAADTAEWMEIADQARQYCGNRARCTIYAWTDAGSAARSLPMTSAQSFAVAVRYVSDRAGNYERVKFDCTRFPPDDEDQCLPMEEDRP